MAAASSSTTFTGLTFLWLFSLLMICVHFPSASSFSFSLDFSKTGDPCIRELVCKGEASFRSSMIELTRNDAAAKDSKYSRGVVWYATPVPLWNASTSEVASFTTTFSFEITRIWSSQGPGDGMAFFLTRYTRDSVLDSTSSAGLLGLFKSGNFFDVTGDSRVVAVEFDTVFNPEYADNSDQHVGIDVNSIKSVSYTNTSSLEMNDKNLTSGFTMTATVRYDNPSKLLAVDLRIDDTLYRVNATVDLRKELPEEVAVGFSASTGEKYQLHRVLSWSFNSSLEAEKVASNPNRTATMSPAPASQPHPAPAVESEPSDKLLLKVLVPISSVSVFAIVLCLLLWLWWKPRRTDNPGFYMGMVVGPRRYLYHELAVATNNFAEGNKLGQGGFGSVYKGHLQNDSNGGQPVAIKKFSADSSSQGRKEFEAEVKIISRLRHRNLVQLLGWCDSPKGLLLVYELVPEGSLDKHIHDNPRLLTWSERYKIILGLGSALSYLHLEWEQCVVHCDIKPSNIMLDSSYNTKLGDFGLARLVDHGSDPQTTALIKGTIGYMDPEFIRTNRRSAESDVYSFGIVLLEIVSGRPPLDRWNSSFELPWWVWSFYSQRATLDAVDARLRPCDDAVERRQMERALVVGLWCARLDPTGRPSVAQAMHALQSEDATALPVLAAHMYRAEAGPPAGFFEAAESGGFVVRSLSRGARSPATARTTPSSE